MTKTSNLPDSDLSIAEACEVRLAVARHIEELIRQYHLTRGQYMSAEHVMVKAVAQCIFHSLNGYQKIAGEGYDMQMWIDQYNDKDRKLLLRIWSGA